MYRTETILFVGTFLKDRGVYIFRFESAFNDAESNLYSGIDKYHHLHQHEVRSFCANILRMSIFTRGSQHRAIEMHDE